MNESNDYNHIVDGIKSIFCNIRDDVKIIFCDNLYSYAVRYYLDRMNSILRDRCGELTYEFYFINGKTPPPTDADIDGRSG